MPEYCTLSQIKQKMPELGDTDDAIIEGFIFAVSAYFDEETQSRFDSETKLQLFSGDGSRRLFIRPTLASAPTLVRVRANAKDTWRTVNLSDIRLMPSGRRTGDPIQWLELIDTPTGTEYIWPESDDTVEITGSWGRATVPEDLSEAAAQTVVNLYRSRGSAGSDMEVGIGGTYMPAIPKAMPHFAWVILQNYKRLVMA